MVSPHIFPTSGLKGLRLTISRTFQNQSIKHTHFTGRLDRCVEVSKQAGFKRLSKALPL